MFQKVLVANRGEIASRVLRTCRLLGVRTVVVHSEADALAPFVREADQRCLIGPAPVAESYLRIDRILAAARSTGAEAIHPGYGLLAENPVFAQAVTKEGLVFVGPRAETIAALGDKLTSRGLATAAGVPVLPASGPLDPADESALHLAAEAVGFPLIVKLSAGGGGIGMVRVEEIRTLKRAVASAARRGASAFGNGTIYLERYVEAGRHVEVQILFDQHARGVHLFERDCSIQRRHQKIIEEARPPGLTAETLLSLQDDALRLGASVGYENAGTVEFLVDPDGRHWFLEVNTRIQVEHPVTEAITGLDLVELQLRLAAGESALPPQGDVVARGHAIEVRVCAEDPLTFLPHPGRVGRWRPPKGVGIRVDAAIEDDSEVSPYYDSLLAKVIAWGEDRATALDRASNALGEMELTGIVHNGPTLARVLALSAFREGGVHTGLLTALAAETPS